MGFDKNRFIGLTDPFDKLLECNICKNICEDAIETLECRHVFCRTCLQSYLDNKDNKICPEKMCDKVLKRKRNKSVAEDDNDFFIYRSHLFRRNHNINKTVSESKVKCDLIGNGCNAEVVFNQLSDHMKSCSHRPNICLNCEKYEVKRIAANQRINKLNTKIEDLKKQLNDRDGGVLGVVPKTEFNERFKDKYEESLKQIEELKNRMKDLSDIPSDQKGTQMDIIIEMNKRNIELKKDKKNLETKLKASIDDRDGLAIIVAQLEGEVKDWELKYNKKDNEREEYVEQNMKLVNEVREKRRQLDQLKAKHNQLYDEKEIQDLNNEISKLKSEKEVIKNEFTTKEQNLKTKIAEIEDKNRLKFNELNERIEELIKDIQFKDNELKEKTKQMEEQNLKIEEYQKQIQIYDKEIEQLTKNYSNFESEVVVIRSKLKKREHDWKAKEELNANKIANLEQQIHTNNEKVVNELKVNKLKLEYEIELKDNTITELKTKLEKLKTIRDENNDLIVKGLNEDISKLEKQVESHKKEIQTLMSSEKDWKTKCNEFEAKYKALEEISNQNQFFSLYQTNLNNLREANQKAAKLSDDLRIKEHLLKSKIEDIKNKEQIIENMKSGSNNQFDWKTKYEDNEKVMKQLNEKIWKLENDIKLKENELKDSLMSLTQISAQNQNNKKHINSLNDVILRLESEKKDIEDIHNSKINKLFEKMVEVEEQILYSTGKAQEWQQKYNELIEKNKQSEEDNQKKGSSNEWKRRYEDSQDHNKELSEKVYQLEKDLELKKRDLKKVRRDRDKVSQDLIRYKDIYHGIENDLKEEMIELKKQKSKLEQVLQTSDQPFVTEFNKYTNDLEFGFKSQMIRCLKDRKQKLTFNTEYVLFGTHRRQGCKIEMSRGLGFRFHSIKTDTWFHIKFESITEMQFCFVTSLPVVLIKPDLFTCRFIRGLLRMSGPSNRWFDVESKGLFHYFLN